MKKPEVGLGGLYGITNFYTEGSFAVIKKVDLLLLNGLGHCYKIFLGSRGAEG